MVNPLYDVRLLEHKGHQLEDDAAARDGLAWADVVFCEWALGNAQWFSRNKRENQVLIVRLHAQEVRARDRLPFIWQIDWSRVDRLVLITHHLYDWMLGEFPVLRDRAALVYNPIDAKGALNRGKDDGVQFTLGLVGMVPALKRVDLAVDLLAELVRIDSRYNLRIKGARPEQYSWMSARTEELAWYQGIYKEIELRGLGAHVFFDAQGNDMPEWYAGIGIILSLSDFEGSHQAVAEGMASGCVPVIRNWEGARRIYPPHHVGRSLHELVERIIVLADRGRFSAESEYCRKYAVDRFEQARIFSKLDAILGGEIRRKSILPISESTLVQRLVLPTVMVLAYIPPDSSGGYRIRVEQEIRHLVRAGCRVELVCLIPAGNAGLDFAEDASVREQANLRRHKSSLETMGCAVHIVPVAGFFSLAVAEADFDQALNVVAAIAKDARVDVIHSEALYCGRFGALLRSRVPSAIYSVDWHGVAPEEEKMTGGHANRIRALEVAEKSLLSESDLNVFVSSAMGRHYEQKYGARLSRSVVVPCCVGDARFINDDSGIDRVEERLVFGYAGTMTHWQCGREMLALFAQLYGLDDRCFFQVLAPERDHETVIRYAAEAGLPLGVLDLREVPHHEVAMYMAKMHVGLLLRRRDAVNVVSSPTKFGEYLAAGTPVILTDCVGDYSGAVAAAGVGLCLPAESLEAEYFPAEVVDQVLDYARTARQHRNAFREACQRYAFDELSWEPAVERWLSAYRG